MSVILQEHDFETCGYCQTIISKLQEESLTIQEIVAKVNGAKSSYARHAKILEKTNKIRLKSFKLGKGGKGRIYEVIQNA